MNRTIKIITVFILTAALLSTSVSAYNYTFTSGADSKISFDKSTQTDDFVTVNPYENVRNNKDAAHIPPPYGVFSGEFPTDVLSPYHSQDKPSAAGTAAYSDYSANENNTSATMPFSLELPQFSDGEILPSTSFFNGERAKILPLYYDDGSIGTLEFARFNKTIKVYEGESLENMLLGAGKFTSASAWDGNCSIAAHNRGVKNNFSFLKDMNIGEKIIYTTPYGTRTYEVASKTQIDETDTSGLAYSSENILSLYTCVQNVADKRWLVVARQILD